MHKVVLIDDEAIITEGLEKVVDWAAHNCRVAALAQDAASGTQAIRMHRPDILFTNIKMPGEDGLTMLAGLKGEFPRMQIAVLTGYRDFEYAQRAIRLGVAKVNFGTEIRYKYVQHYQEGLERLNHQGHSWKLSQYASDALVEDVKKIIELSGSAHKV